MSKIHRYSEGRTNGNDLKILMHVGICRDSSVCLCGEQWSVMNKGVNGQTPRFSRSECELNDQH